MCGIAGFLGDFDADLLAAMSRLIAHRGPDDAGEYHDPACGLGLAHRRLSILDLSAAGHQPMWDPDRRVAVVYNGEIYNFRDLRHDLTSQGVSFRSNSDTEVLLQLYLAHGAEMLSHLNGIFAFALWDQRDRTLFLARDASGVKPLYYADLGRGFLFASELKALLASPRVGRELDLEALHWYLTYLWCPAPQTPLKACRKLPPGHALRIRAEEPSHTWRWAPPPVWAQPGEIQPEAEAVQALRNEVETAVHRQMVSDVQVGAFLSGGLDSSAIVACAAPKAQPQELPCFTIDLSGHGEVWEGFAADLPYARSAAAHLGVPLHAIAAGPDLATRLGAMVYHLDEPQGDVAPLHVHAISSLAREHGIKVLLSGAGGDDLLAGYRRHSALALERWWKWAPRPLRRVLRSLWRALPCGRATRRRAERAFRYADAAPLDRLLGYYHWLPLQTQLALYSPELRAVASALPFSAPLRRTLSDLPRTASPLQQMLHLEEVHFLADHNLNYTDKLAMACGVEVRVPLLDPDLAAFCRQLPDTLKLRGRVGKYLLKRAAAPWLPAAILDRPKTGFGVPLRHWLHNPLRDMAEDCLSPRTLQARGLFDPTAVGQLRQADAAGAIDAAYPLLTLMLVELWARTFLDQSIPAPVT